MVVLQVASDLVPRNHFFASWASVSERWAVGTASSNLKILPRVEPANLNFRRPCRPLTKFLSIASYTITHLGSPLSDHSTTNKATEPRSWVRWCAAFTCERTQRWPSLLWNISTAESNYRCGVMYGRGSSVLARQRCHRVQEAIRRHSPK